MHQCVGDKFAQGLERELREVSDGPIRGFDGCGRQVRPQPRHGRGKDSWNRAIHRRDIDGADARVTAANISCANHELWQELLRIGP